MRRQTRTWHALAAVLAVALLALPAFPVSARGGSHAWPPPEWTRGDFDDLSLKELALLSAGLDPRSDAGRQAKVRLAPLDDLPAEYKATARTMLEGLAEARWHQERAWARLDARERALVADADPLAPATGQLLDALGQIDDAELLQSLAALARSAQAITDSLQQANPPAPGRLADALADSVGRATPPSTRPMGDDELASLLLGLGAAPQDADVAALALELEALPRAVQRAVADIALGLADVAANPDSGRAVAGLAARVDRAAPVLREYSALLVARAVWLAHAQAALGLPDPTRSTPALRAGLPALPAGTLPPAPPLAEALDHAARALGLPAVDRAAVPALGPGRERALAAFFEQAARHMEALSAAALTPPPAALADDPGLLEAWGTALGAGDAWPAKMPADDLALLEQALPFLRAQHAVLVTRDQMLAAAEDLVPAFTASAAAEPAPCVQGPPLSPLLNLDACGETSSWVQPALLTLDVGGADRHLQGIGAPFTADLPVSDDRLPRQVGVPLTLVLDLGGSDTYDGGDAECTLAAACPDRSDAAIESPNSQAQPVVSLLPAAWRIAPLAVLLDWDRDGADAHNVFRSGDRSQGYASAIDPGSPGIGNPGSFAPQAFQPYALLVERVGDGSRLVSEYVAGNKSQGSAVGRSADAAASPRPMGGTAALLRLVGSDSDATSTFVAGDDSQGSTAGSLPATHGSALALLANLAGQRTRQDDTYVAGTRVQGAAERLDSLSTIPSHALMLDWAGPGSRSNDTYTAANKAQGWVPAVPVSIAVTASNRDYAFFMDAVASGAEAVVGPTLPSGGSGPTDPDLGVSGEAAGVPSWSDDAYTPLPEGRGHGFGVFVDLGGADGYASTPARAGNDRHWSFPSRSVTLGLPYNGLDSRALSDEDRDAMPAAVEDAWRDFVQLWDAGDADADQTALPVPARFVVDLDGATLALDRSYAFVLSAFGNDWYGPHFSANLLLDLDGNDRHLGGTAAATLLPPGWGEAPDEPLRDAGRDATHEDTGPVWDALDAASEQLAGQVDGLVGSVTDPDVPEPVGDKVPSVKLPRLEAAGAPPPPAQSRRALAVTLDLDGDDDYGDEALGLPATAQGYGQGHAAGLLLDLRGNDDYTGGSFVQGVGLSGGVGVLADVGPDSVNRLVAGSPGQGYSQGAGSLGILAVQGKHNELRDGGQAGEEVRPGESDGEPDGSLGLSENLATAGNGGPSIVGDPTRPAGEPAIGQLGDFSVEVSDPEGDRLEVCWTFEEALAVPPECHTVTPDGPDDPVEVTHQRSWTTAATDGRDPLLAHAVPYEASVEVRDPGGRTDSAPLGVFLVHNEPLALGAVRGPRSVAVPDGDPSARAAYQVRLADAVMRDPASHRFEVDWGDGQGPVDHVAVPVDWADIRQRAQLRDSVVADGREVCRTGPLEAATDGNGATFASLTFGQGCPPVHAVVEFDGPRFVDEVRLALGRTGATDPVTLSIEGIREDGQVVLIGKASHDAVDPDEIETEVLGLGANAQDLIAVQLRAISENLSPNTPQALFVHSFEAFGPGLVHDWASAGDFTVDLTVVNPSEGRNGTQVDVAVTAGGALSFPVEYSDFSGRGPVAHASVATGTPYVLDLRALATDETLEACIEPQPGADLLCSSPQTGLYHHYRISWDDAGSHPVRLLLLRDGEAVGERLLLTAEATDGFDLFVDSLANVEGDASASAQPVQVLPILFLDLDPAAPRTWYSGTPYLGIVDSGGNDRYSGPVAASHARTFPAASPSNLGAPPSLLVDLSGNDDYLSTLPGTQGFGSLASVSLLVDAGGDDVYVAPGLAQGSALNMGIGVLVDGDGDDAFNPVQADHPDVLAGLADAAEGWEGRPTSLAPPRAALAAPTGPLMQGAAQDGLGLLFLHGGFDLLEAGPRAQGYGSRSATSATQYFVPEPECLVPPQVTSGPQPTSPPAADPNFPEVDSGNPYSLFDQSPLCMLGAHDWQPLPPPFPPELQTPDDSDRLFAFVASGPRFGGGVGGLIQDDGFLVLRASGQAQGAADPGGRGLLADRDGGLAAIGGDRSQAYAASGVASLAAGGPAVLRASARSQAREEASAENPDDGAAKLAEGLVAGSPDPTVPAMPSAAILVRPLDADEECLASCGNGHVVDTVAPPGGPALSWAQQPPNLVAASPLRLSLGIQPTLPLQESHIEVVAIALSQPWGTLGSCAGLEAMHAPASVLAHAFLPPASTTLAIEADLDALLDDGPVFPQGCMEVRVFARQGVASGPAGPWSFLPADIVLVRPPPLRLVEDRLAGGNGDITFHVEVADPLASTRAPDLELAVKKGPAEPQGGFAPDSWLSVPGGAVATATWDSSAAEQGVYTVWARAAWDRVGSPFGPWVKLTEDLLVDRTPPTGETARPVPTSWRLDRDLVLEGNATDAQGVQRIAFRLLDAAGEPLLLAVPGGTQADATLDQVGAIDALWSVRLRVTAGFPGGPVDLQWQLEDMAGTTSDWVTLREDLILDGAAPRVASLVTESQSAGSDGVFPILFTVELKDAAQRACPSCEGGTGVNATSVFGVAVQGAQVFPLKRLSVTPHAGGAATAVLEWTGDGNASPGIYNLRVQALDRAGNLGVEETGVDITVDLVKPAPPEVAVDGNPAAVKPTDVLHLAVVAHDVGTPPSGIAEVQATLLGALATGVPDMNGDLALDLVVPTATEEAGRPLAAVDQVTLRVTSIDTAGNFEATDIPLQYHRMAPILDPAVPAVVTRTDRLWLDLHADRPLTLDEALLHGPHGDIPAIVTGGPQDFRFTFLGLDAETGYSGSVTLHDLANYVVDVPIDVATPPANVGDLLLDPPPPYPVSRTVSITGVLQLALSATVDLQLRSDAVPGILASRTVSTVGGMASPFSLEWNSGEFNGEITFTLEADDGSFVRQAVHTLVVDNLEPTLDVHLSGPRSQEGWYPGDVTLTAAASDASGAVTVFERNGRGEEMRSALRLATDGMHHVRVIARDGAFPPNEVADTWEVLVDATPPLVNATLGPEVPFPLVSACKEGACTPHLAIPINVTSWDAGSGVSQYRVSTEDWSTAWNATRPDRFLLPARLPDGGRFVNVEAQDIAGNVESTALYVTVDRAAPELLAARWVGRASGQWVLHVVAQDILNGTSGVLPSGVAAVRFAPPDEDEWTRWFPFDGNDGVPVPPQALARSTARLQLKDAAGNVGAIELLPVNDLPVREPSLTVSDDGPPPQALLTRPAVEPVRGTPSTPFVFGVTVDPWRGQLPDEVWVEVDGERHAAAAQDPELDGGARFYAVVLRMDLSRLDAPHTFRTVALYGDEEVASPPQDGPTVLLFLSDVQPQSAGDGGVDLKEAPLPGLGLLAAALLIALARRRRG